MRAVDDMKRLGCLKQAQLKDGFTIRLELHRGFAAVMFSLQIIPLADFIFSIPYRLVYLLFELKEPDTIKFLNNTSHEPLFVCLF